MRQLDESNVFLKYGVNQDGELISIDECESGRANLCCPYCNVQLLARKGQVKTHHFAHIGHTCKIVAGGRLPALPLFDKFSLRLKQEEFIRLQELWKEYGAKGWGMFLDDKDPLVRTGIMEWNDYRRKYYFSKLGKIPLGLLSLRLFNKIQEPKILGQLEVHERYFKSTLEEKGSFTAKERSIARTNYEIYRIMMRRILSTRLYFLEIQTDGTLFYKIGVTSRDMSERLKEIQVDLNLFFSNPAIKVLGTWQHRGNVEFYFKYKYKRWNYRLGRLTEYFLFDDIKAVLRDLKGMGQKHLSERELEILEGYSEYRVENE